MTPQSHVLNQAMVSIMFHQYSTLIGPVPLPAYRTLCRTHNRSFRVINYVPTLDDLDKFTVKPLKHRK